MNRLYDRVIAFISEQLGVPADRITAETTLFGDLRTDGDDGSELLEAFAREFSVDVSACYPGRYFGDEGLPLGLPSLRRGDTPEERAGLRPIRIADLVRSAESGRWDCR